MRGVPRTDLREEEVAEEVGDHLVGLEDALVGLDVALVPRDAVGDAVEDHPQLAARRRTVMLMVIRREIAHEAALQSVSEVFLDGVLVNNVLRQVEGLQMTHVQIPVDADAKRVRQTGSKEVCGEREVAREKLHRVYVRSFILKYRRLPESRRLPSRPPCYQC